MPHVTDDNKPVPDVTEWKKTLVIPNLFEVCGDPKLWEPYVEKVNSIDRSQTLVMLPEGMDERTTVFLRNNDGWCSLLDYQFFGFLKEAGNTLKDIVRYETTGKRARATKEGIAALRNKLTRYVFCGPRIMLASRNGGYYRFRTKTGGVEIPGAFGRCEGMKDRRGARDSTGVGRSAGFSTKWASNSRLR